MEENEIKPKRVTDQRYILLAAIQQVDNIVSLLEENEWKNYMYQHLSPVRYELERQLSNLENNK